MSDDKPYEPVIGIDATPDAEYPLRILRAHRKNVYLPYDTSIEGAMAFIVNLPANEKRVRLLDRAIEILEAANPQDKKEERP